MPGDSSANASFEESNGKEPLTPNVNTSTRNPELNTPAGLVDQKFKLFDDITTPLQRSTNLLNQKSAPPFLRNSNDVSLANQISNDLGLDLAISALNLGFGDNNSNISTKAIDSEKDKEGDESSNSIDPNNENIDSNKENPEHHPNQFNDGNFPHHQHFPPFFPMNGFGQPLPGGFDPSKHLDHPQPWSAKPGQPHFPNGLGTVGLDSLNSPIPPPGMIPIPFDFGPDGVSPLPHRLHPDGFVNLGDENSLKERAFTPPADFANMDNSFNNGLQNNQLWPPLNGAHQSFDNSFAAMGGISPNGLGPNSDPRFFSNNGTPNNHHHHHHNNHGRKYLGPRKRGEDASKFANAKLEDFIGQIYSLCKDQHGCRFLQKQLDVSDENATIIFQEIHPYVIELMVDPFGNYLIQKLLENVNNEERVILVKNASVQFVQIALDSHGTRALQKLVECIDTEEEAKIIVESLKNDVVSLSRDLNGNHVIQKCLQRLTSSDSQFIFDTASQNCPEIATHRHGCCVLQRCLDYGSEKQCKDLSLVISKFTKDLSLDPYGNYVIQYVLTKNADDEPIKKIIGVVKSNMVTFALHKFGSNVIEKCLKSTKYSSELINELIENEQDLVKLLNDSYGNYVLQTSLDVAKVKQFEKLSSILKPLLPQVRNTPHGRRISSRLQQTA